MWQKWSTREEISSIGLELRSADPDEVQVGWRALVADGSDTTGVLTINPALADCKSVDVLAAQGVGAPTPLTPHEEIFKLSMLTTPESVEAIWTTVHEPACKLLLVFRRSDEHNTIAVSASWQGRASVSIESIGAPRQPAGHTLLPASVVADTASAIMIVPIAVCLGMGDECGRMLMSVGPH